MGLMGGRAPTIDGPLLLKILFWGLLGPVVLVRVMQFPEYCSHCLPFVFAALQLGCLEASEEGV